MLMVRNWKEKISLVLGAKSTASSIDDFQKMHSSARTCYGVDLPIFKRLINPFPNQMIQVSRPILYMASRVRDPMNPKIAVGNIQAIAIRHRSYPGYWQVRCQKCSGRSGTYPEDIDENSIDEEGSLANHVLLKI